MDEEATNYGISHRDTSEGATFDLYWRTFNGLTKENGVKKNDVILIRHFCHMFGASFTVEVMKPNLAEEEEKEHNLAEESKEPMN